MPRDLLIKSSFLYVTARYNYTKFFWYFFPLICLPIRTFLWKLLNNNVLCY
jgi:hypothetical protein